MACLTAVARKPRQFDLTEDGRRELEKLVRTPSTPAGLSRRARAVLLMADGFSGAEIAKRLGYTVVQVSRLRRRVAAEGPAGVYELLRPGRPPEIAARQMAHTLAVTPREPE